MTPEQMAQRIQMLEDRLNGFLLKDRYRIVRDFEFGTLRGSKIGMKATQKLSFYGVIPIIQAGAISAPNAPGGTYAQSDAVSAVAAINSIRTALKNLGLTA